MKPMRASWDLIHEFARYTGDYSPLHVDREFGKRSQHEQNIVHGMLPVFYVLQCEDVLALCKKGLVPHSVSGRFSAALFPEEEFCFSLEQELISPNGAELTEVSYSLIGMKYPSQSEFFRGRLLLVRHQDTSKREKQTQSHSQTENGRFVVSPFKLNQFYIDQIERGVSGSSLFKIPKTREELESIQTGFSQWVALAHLSASLSPLVGMLMPGSTATFQDFSVSMEQLKPSFADWNLNHKVSFVSPTVRTVVQTVEWQQDGEVIATGRCSSSVAKRPTSSTSMESLPKKSEVFGLDGKVALVTGASRGIGAAIAKTLSLQGCKVVVNFRSNKEAAEAVRVEIEASGGIAYCIQADVSSFDQVDKMMKAIEDHPSLGGVDFVVNNAVASFASVDLKDLNWEDIESDINVVVKGAFLVCKAASSMMIKRGGGAIVNLATVATDLPPARQIKYVTAKSALVGLTRSLAVDLAPANIRVNAVVPSMVETDLTSRMSPLAIAEQKAASPMRRLATPRDVASAVLYLLSDLSAYTTGQRIMVNGGGAPFV